MLRKLRLSAAAAIIVGMAFAFATPQTVQAATTDPSYFDCPVAPIFIWSPYTPTQIEPCYSISPRGPMTDTVLQRLAVRTFLEAWNPNHLRFEVVKTDGWWTQLAQSGVGGYENNTYWTDQYGRGQYGLQCYQLTWAELHPFGNFRHYFRVRTDFAWGAPFTFTSPVPSGYIGSATLYEDIGLV